METLRGWDRGEHTAYERGMPCTHPTYRKGDGPGVIVIHEMPGLTRGVGCRDRHYCVRVGKGGLSGRLVSQRPEFRCLSHQVDSLHSGTYTMPPSFIR